MSYEFVRNNGDLALTEFEIAGFECVHFPCQTISVNVLDRNVVCWFVCLFVCLCIKTCSLSARKLCCQNITIIC